MPGGITVAIDQDDAGANRRRRSLTVAGAAQFVRAGRATVSRFTVDRLLSDRAEPKAQGV
ncbi:hypothetical protein SBBP1_110050 [Burkholderiales bacterium]|nr:hypothetical protein SBBP1_110050 [Burkholderiales bacterium]